MPKNVCQEKYKGLDFKTKIFPSSQFFSFLCVMNELCKHRKYFQYKLKLSKYKLYLSYNKYQRLFKCRLWSVALNCDSYRLFPQLLFVYPHTRKGGCWRHLHWVYPILLLSYISCISYVTKVILNIVFARPVPSVWVGDKEEDVAGLIRAGSGDGGPQLRERSGHKRHHK